MGADKRTGRVVKAFGDYLSQDECTQACAQGMLDFLQPYCDKTIAADMRLSFNERFGLQPDTDGAAVLLEEDEIQLADFPFKM